MKFPSTFFCRCLREWALPVALIAGPILACGPDFPESYFAMPEEALLAAPEGFFAAEIARMIPAGAPPFRGVRVSPENARQQTFDLDVAEVKRALAERGARDSRRISSAYEEARRALETWVDRTQARDGVRQEQPWPNPPQIELPPELPAEFRHYFAGALAWHQRQPDRARREWTAVLALPAGERRFRTVWATFMLGRLAVDALAATPRGNGDATAALYAEARQRMRETREWVAEGFPDALGLAAASWGWEGRAALTAGEFPAAINLYVAQQAAGDDTAVASLRRAASEAINRESRDYEALARDPVARRVVTAWFVACGAQLDETAPILDQIKAWAVALEHANLGSVPDADRLAWLAYEAGFFSLAERWVALASRESAEAQWIRAKLALRSGNLRDGERFLREAVAGKTLSEAHQARALAELERVCLARDDFAGALTAAIEGGHWEDAAFVAERVMTTMELKRYVDTAPVSATPQVIRIGWRLGEMPRELRHLLARRLVRDGDTEHAGNYFPSDLRDKFQMYVDDVRAGFDPARSASERAAAFWRAAQCVHEHGQELLGTELEPDWAIWGGNFASPASAAVRREGPAKIGGIFAPTPAELKRLEAQPAPERRFHYRYRAADLAWWAAALLPNDSGETAQILTEAGGWLKARDPQGADRFYQALVIRCGNTALGRSAAQAHWFPKPRVADGF